MTHNMMPKFFVCIRTMTIAFPTIESLTNMIEQIRDPRPFIRILFDDILVFYKVTIPNQSVGIVKEKHDLNKYGDHYKCTTCHSIKCKHTDVLRLRGLLINRRKLEAQILKEENMCINLCENIYA